MSRTTELASETHFAGPLWLREDVGAIYAKGEVHTGPFSMPLLRMADLDKLPTKGLINSPPKAASLSWIYVADLELRLLNCMCFSGNKVFRIK